MKVRQVLSVFGGEITAKTGRKVNKLVVQEFLDAGVALTVLRSCLHLGEWRNTWADGNRSRLEISAAGGVYIRVPPVKPA